MSCDLTERDNHSDGQFWEYELEFLKHENLDLENQLYLSTSMDKYSTVDKHEDYEQIKEKLRKLNLRIRTKDYSQENHISDLSDNLFLKYIPENIYPSNYQICSNTHLLSDSLSKQITFQRYKRIILSRTLGEILGSATLLKPKVTAISHEDKVLFLFGILDSNIQQNLRIDSIHINRNMTILNPELTTNGYIHSLEIEEEGEIEFYGNYIIKSPDGNTFKIPFVEEIKK